jgi:hypothetical protein
VCGGGTALDCSDSDICTFDDCDPATGCVNATANFDTASFSVARVDGRDLVMFADAWNSCPGDTRFDPATNLDRTACVDLTDFHLFMNTFGRSCQ